MIMHELHPRPCRPRRPRRRRPLGGGFSSGFSLVELMTVLAIITVLITILIPTVKKVRDHSRIAGAKNQIMQINAAIERFYQEQGRYPGPLPDSALATDMRAGNPPKPGIRVAGAAMADEGKITQAENLVLGLFGGLKWVTGGSGYELTYDPAMVGKGMIGMNPNQPKKSQPYLDDLKMLSDFPGNHTDPNNANWPGEPYKDGAGTADDSRIPEILDNFSYRMPILYLRAHVGANGIAVDDTAVNPPAQYVLSDMLPYTKGSFGSIGEGKDIDADDYKNPKVAPSPGVFPHGLQSADNTKNMDKTDTANFQFPYDAYPYFASPTDPQPLPTRTTPRKKDAFILISAGLDRVYGTADDITNFGSVLPE